MSRGKRGVKLVTGVWQDRYGRTIVVKVHGRQHERRYARTTPIETLQRERKLFERELRQQRAPEQRGTLNADVVTFLATLTGARKRDAAYLLGLWTAAPLRDQTFGQHSRHALTAADIGGQLARWASRFSPGTRNHLRQVLGALYRVLDGAGGRNPVRDVRRVPVRYEDARALPYALIEAILQEVPSAANRARLRVMATTGLPQSQIGRLEARDVDLEAGTVTVPARRKGAGSAPRTLPLAPQAIAAFRELAAADAWGPFSAQSLAKRWREAVAAAKANWNGPWPAPKHVRPYDLRHSFGTAVYAATGDLRATAELLGHATLQMAKRYTTAAVPERNRAAIDAVASRLTGASRVPAGRVQTAPKSTPMTSGRTRPAGTANRPTRAKKA